MIGQTLSHYRITEKLGEGGMGVVYRALDTHLDRPAAIKVLRREAMGDPQRKRRFVQEAKAASALNHPNIITIYDIDQVDGVDFIAMEYVAGKTLDQSLPRKGFRLGEALRYAVQIADALAAAHAAAIVHRDLKPANIMVSEKGLVKVLDFGLAKLTEPVGTNEATVTLDRAPHTEEGTIVGTVAFMSPEQAQGLKVDARSDVFSFGSVLYEMVTGERAFHGSTKVSTLSAILHQEPKPLRDRMEVVPHQLEWVLSRCLKKEAGQRFQHIDDVKLALEDLKEESASAPAMPPPQRRRRVVGTIAGTVILLAATAGLSWWLARRGEQKPGLVLTRLTSDSGLTTDPALSPDGKLLAFASDRSGEGNLDIWVKQMPDGQPVRLTRDDADESEPAFSPDGTKIAYRSVRDGGGIWVIPALGGDARLVARPGRRPRFSPDGRSIAYWIGEEHNLLVGAVHVVAASGGPPRQIASLRGSCPLWSPDGQHLLVAGTASGAADWWVVPQQGGAPVRTGAFATFQKRGLSDYGVPGQWQDEGQVIFAARLGDSTNLWQVPVAAKTWQVTGEPRRLSFGAGLEALPSAGAGRLVFASLNLNIDLFSLPMDPNRAKVLGDPKRLTVDAAPDIRPSVSADGRKVVFQSSRSGNDDVWIKDLDTGRETALAATPVPELRPVISADGSKVVYGTIEDQKPALYTVPAGGGVPEKVCGDCDLPWQWSADKQSVLFRMLRPNRLGLLKLGDGEPKSAGRSPNFAWVRTQFSPDERWVAFHVSWDERKRRVFIAPFRNEAVAPESEWIAVTDGKALDREASWSPDGNLLYYLTEREGFRCLWAQRLDPATKRLLGPAFEVYGFHKARLSMLNFADTGWAAPSVARDKIVLTLGEQTGNIWMATP